MCLHFRHNYVIYATPTYQSPQSVLQPGTGAVAVPLVPSAQWPEGSRHEHPHTHTAWNRLSLWQLHRGVGSRGAGTGGGKEGRREKAREREIL